MTLYTGIFEPEFGDDCSFVVVLGRFSCNKLRKFQRQAAIIITDSSYDTLNRLLVRKHGWKTTEELHACESNKMVFHSLHRLAPYCLCDSIIHNSKCTSYVQRKSDTDGLIFWEASLLIIFGMRTA